MTPEQEPEKETGPSQKPNSVLRVVEYVSAALFAAAGVACIGLGILDKNEAGVGFWSRISFIQELTGAEESTLWIILGILMLLLAVACLKKNNRQ